MSTGIWEAAGSETYLYLDPMEILSREKVSLLTAMVDALTDVPGVAAVVLGGSQAAGLASEQSDLDIGIYYFEKEPFDVDDIRQIANKFSAAGNAVVTGLYGWGPWVNGGTWIETDAGKVDFVYRNINQVQQVITDAVNGIWNHHFDQQPPYGFRSVIYLAETQVCKPLYDPRLVIESFKKQVAVYPAALQQTIISDSLWLSEFTFMQCEPFARAGDVYNTVGCFTRIAQYLVQALFAINKAYPMSDKRASQLIDAFKKSPPGFTIAINNVLGNAGTRPDELQQSMQVLKRLWTEIVELVDGGYQARF